MARTNPVKPSQANGDIKNIFNQLEKKLGKVPNIFQYMGNSSALLKGLIQWQELAETTSLTPALREQIALSISEHNHCNYCTAAHTLMGQGVGLTKEQTIEARKGEASDKKTEAILSFCNHFIRKDGLVSDEEVQSLKKLGVSDQELGDIFFVMMLTLCTNYFNHLNETPIDFPEVQNLESITSSLR